MSEKSRSKVFMILNRIARILAIAFAVFISLFALDVFVPGVPLGKILQGLLIHLIPTYIILILTWITWKHPMIGGILFILAGAAYPILAKGEDLIAFLLIGGIPIMIGILFLAGSGWNRAAK
jgi:hypothetical protein